jgi:hypothetical protein
MMIVSDAEETRPCQRQFAGGNKRIEHDYEDTITRHEYEHEHVYDARRYDYDRRSGSG